MILTETHNIKLKAGTKDIYQKMDGYCFASKNLRNSVNYIITQCKRISYKLRDGEIIDSWEKALIYRVNCAIQRYNNTPSRKAKTPIRYIDDTNGYIADAYFLSWWLKGTKEYQEMPYASSAQICIQMICRDWKAFYYGIKAYKKNPSLMLGRPQKPNYYDKETGRNWIVITNQSFKRNEDGTLKLPKFLDGIFVKTSKEHLNQIRIKTTGTQVKIQLMYETPVVTKSKDTSRVMSIDLGVSNLAAVVSNTDLAPFIVNGRPLKSINQFYNKELARLRSIATGINHRYLTKRILKLSEVRNNKVKDYMHKTSRLIVDKAIANNIGLIVIGSNKGWKQKSHIGKQNNQNFVGIPFYQLVHMIEYKAALVGIEVKLVDEAYTSGTSYLDDETPVRAFYNKSRRIERGLFRSNCGITINADVNAGYQIMKKVNIVPPIKFREQVSKHNVA